jgi:O-acetylhomoserine/O-acetylserine sulfhydrylase
MVSGHLGHVTKAPEYETIALHGAQEPDPINGSRALPLYQTCAYNFTDAADGASKFAWSKEGYVYTRMGNPTNSVFESRMAMLEGGVGAVATASGHAAQVSRPTCNQLNVLAYKRVSSWPLLRSANLDITL